MNKNYLEIKDVSFFYKNREILKNISFCIDKGDSLSIFGPNGSGKTTLLKILIGLLKPQKGEVYFKGIDIFKINERERGKIFSYVPQKVNINFPLKTFDFLLTGRAPYINGFVKKEDKDIVLNWMEKFNIIHLREINFQLLSEGEKQLLTLIRTLIQEAEIIVLDEPLNHLDLKYKIKILKLLKEIKLSGKTVISVFHEIDSIKFLSDKVIFLKNGKIEKFGEIEKLIKKDEIINLFEENIPFLI